MSRNSKSSFLKRLLPSQWSRGSNSGGDGDGLPLSADLLAQLNGLPPELRQQVCDPTLLKRGACAARARRTYGPFGARGPPLPEACGRTRATRPEARFAVPAQLACPKFCIRLAAPLARRTVRGGAA